MFNNSLQGIFLRDDFTRTAGIPGYTGHRASIHNNLLIGNGIESIYPPGVGAPILGGREIQVEDRCDLGWEAIRTNSLNGNVYYTHAGDSVNYDVNNPLFWTFRVRPNVAIVDLPDCMVDPYAPTTAVQFLDDPNDDPSWIDVVQEGMDSYTVDLNDPDILSVDLQDLAFPASGSEPNQFWPLLTFSQPSSVDLLPTCNTTANGECDPHSYGDAGANLNAVFGTWLDNPPPSARVGVDAHGQGEVVMTISDPYPNPFTSEATVDVSIAEPASVSIRLLDILGRLVSQSEQTLSPGRNSVRIRASNFAAGFYVMQVRVSGPDSHLQTFTRRLLHVN